MKCLVTSFGSAGDFLPTVALAAALKRRGHEISFVTNPFYESRARSAGLELIPAGPHRELFALFEQKPEYGDPANFGTLFNDVIAPHNVALYPVVHDMLRRERFDFMIANDASFSAVWAAKELGVPSVVAHASPMIWVNARAPVVLTDRPLPRWINQAVTLIAPYIANHFMTRWLRPLARQVGTSVQDASFRATGAMPALRLGLWSPLLRGPLKNDPANGQICGYTHSSAFGGVRHELTADVEAFLNEGPPPLVVGFGSAFSLISGPVLATIAAACAERNLRCLIVGHPTGMTFPSNTLAVPYAPYDQVFPRAAAVAVHCGSGTTGEALRCGRPILAVPFAFDQLGLGGAIEALGVGIRVRKTNRTRADFTGLIDSVVNDDGLRRRAAEIAPRFAAERDGAETGADAIEQLLGTRPHASHLTV